MLITDTLCLEKVISDSERGVYEGSFAAFLGRNTISTFKAMAEAKEPYAQSNLIPTLRS